MMGNNNKPTSLDGARIRSLRRRQNMSIKDFAQEAGISVGHVSQLERNLIEPSLVVIRRICEVLGVGFHTLLAGNAGDVMLSRQEDDRLVFPDSNAIYTIRTPAVLSNGRLPQLSVSTACIPGMRWDHAEPVSHEGDEYVYVLHGRIEYHTDQGMVTAGAGDSLYVKAGTPHRIYNPLPEEAEMLAVFSALWRDPAPARRTTAHSRGESPDESL